ncbi:tetratricopeptide repeat protein [Xenorhabdus littoralis]|uniref:tetratricopeptide repeat protein n=1 Tax=Xenorhabdus littoralis TaxID=2582835 RepID=UPI0029E7DF8F|nr:tetratricopeptide repeat protein [Xenorhabdus sp. psl]MDX7990494.1 sel1 repeat family protein [Xenorhabdus sp. psl]
MERLTPLCFLLSFCLLTTACTPNDPCQIDKTSFSTCLKLANQGDKRAQFTLSLFYAKGLGVEQDYQKAIVWGTKAAKQGSPDGQSILGFFYMKGLGVPKDGSVAMKWFLKAAAQGDAYAPRNLAMIYELGHVVPRDYKKALELYQKASDKDFSNLEAKIQELKEKLNRSKNSI